MELTIIEFIFTKGATSVYNRYYLLLRCKTYRKQTNNPLMAWFDGESILKVSLKIIISIYSPDFLQNI